VVSIPGDLNGDIKVGLPDLVILAQAYGTTPNSPKWNPNADIDGNGAVGLSDLVIMAEHSLKPLFLLSSLQRWRASAGIKGQGF